MNASASTKDWLSCLGVNWKSLVKNDVDPLELNKKSDHI